MERRDKKYGTGEMRRFGLVSFEQLAGKNNPLCQGGNKILSIRSKFFPLWLGIKKSAKIICGLDEAGRGAISIQLSLRIFFKKL